MEELIKLFKEKLGEDVFTDDVSEKLKTNYDLAVQEAVKAKREELETSLEEEYKKKADELVEKEQELETKKEQLEEKYEAELSEFKTEMIEGIDKYLDIASEKFFDDNRIAIESELKVQTAEKIIESAKSIFEGSEILTLNEEEFKTVETLEGKIKELEEDVENSFKKEMELKEQIDNEKCKSVFKEKTNDLTSKQVETVEEMLEGIEFKNHEDFSKKLDIVLEKFSSKKGEVVTESDNKSGINKYLS